MTGNDGWWLAQSTPQLHWPYSATKNRTKSEGELKLNQKQCRNLVTFIMNCGEQWTSIWLCLKINNRPSYNRLHIKRINIHRFCSLVEISNWSSLCFICLQSSEHSFSLIIGSLSQWFTCHIVLALHTQQPPQHFTNNNSINTIQTMVSIQYNVVHKIHVVCFLQWL